MIRTNRTAYASVTPSATATKLTVTFEGIYDKILQNEVTRRNLFINCFNLLCVLNDIDTSQESLFGASNSIKNKHPHITKDALKQFLLNHKFIENDQEFEGLVNYALTINNETQSSSFNRDIIAKSTFLNYLSGELKQSNTFYPVINNFIANLLQGNKVVITELQNLLKQNSIVAFIELFKQAIKDKDTVLVLNLLDALADESVLSLDQTLSFEVFNCIFIFMNNLEEKDPAHQQVLSKIYNIKFNYEILWYIPEFIIDIIHNKLDFITNLQGSTTLTSKGPWENNNSFKKIAKDNQNIQNLLKLMFSFNFKPDNLLLIEKNSPDSDLSTIAKGPFNSEIEKVYVGSAYEYDLMPCTANILKLINLFLTAAMPKNINPNHQHTDLLKFLINQDMANNLIDILTQVLPNNPSLQRMFAFGLNNRYKLLSTLIDNNILIYKIVEKMLSPDNMSFTDIDAQIDILEAIHDKKFTTNNSTRLLLTQLIAQNKFNLTSEKVQNLIIQIILDKSLIVSDQEDTVIKNVLVEFVCQNPFVFTGEEAQRKIAQAICEQKFGTNPAVLSKLLDLVCKEPFIFNSNEGQAWIAKAICEQEFGTDPTVLSKSLKLVCREPFVFTDGKAQKLIAQIIYEHKFGTDPEVLSKLLELICREPFVFIGGEAQKKIAQAICKQKFGTDLAVLSKLVNLVFRYPFSFTGYNAQGWIARAILEQKFGTDPAVLSRLAGLVCREPSVFTNYEAQELISRAICEQKFGTNPEVLSKLLELICREPLVFADGNAQRLIAQQKFGTNPELLSELLYLVYIKPFVLTYKRVQKWIVQAIHAQKVGTDPAVLSRLADLVCREALIFTDREAQILIAQAIYEQKFGTDPAVLSRLADLVCREALIFTDREAQILIAQAIIDFKFGIEKETLSKLVDLVCREPLVFTDGEAQRLIAQQKFGTNPEVLSELLIEKHKG